MSKNFEDRVGEAMRTLPPPPPPVSDLVGAARRQHGQRRRLETVGVAAAVVLASAGATAGVMGFAGNGGSREQVIVPAGPSASAAPSATTPSREPATTCRQDDLAARFAGGGLGTGNDFGSILVWNTGSTRCRISGAVSFTAYFSDGSRDANARLNRSVPPVDVVLAAHTPAYRDGADRSHYLTAELMGPERDDPAQPNGMCRTQDKIAPDTLVLTVGAFTFRVPNSDPDSLQALQVYGCHGQVLLERV